MAGRMLSPDVTGLERAATRHDRRIHHAGPINIASSSDNKEKDGENLAAGRNPRQESE